MQPFIAFLFLIYESEQQKTSTYLFNAMVKITETELIKGCKKNNPKVQRQLYEMYSGRMLAICRRYIKHTDEAEEIMVNGFLKVFDKIEQFKSEGSFEGWIKKIMVFEALNHLRKQKMVFVEIEAAQYNENIDYSNAQTHLEVQDLMNLLDELPAGYRTVFNLYAIEGYSHQEIAEMLQISESTSKSQLSRARVHLQKKVGDLNENLKLQYGK